MSHVDEMACLLYLEGQLDRPRALELSSHVESCATCRALLGVLERESRLLAHAMVEEDEAVPARLLAPPARNATPWAWIVSFGLAAAGAYTLWTGIIEPWRQQLNQAGLGESNLLTMLFFGGVFWKGWETMANAVQFLAMTTLAILVFGLLRRTWRRWTTIAVVMSTLLGVLLLPALASAAEIKKGEAYTLPSGEVVKNDLIVGGTSVQIDGDVEGDLIAFGQKITVNGHITGDVIAFGKFVRVNGRVDGNVRAFANVVSLSGPVGKNVSVFAGSTDLDSKSQVGGGMMLFVGDATLDGRLSRDLLGFIGRTVINGFIGGDLRLKGDHLTIGDRAEIDGKASYRGQHQPTVSQRAKLASPLEIEIVKRRPNYSSVRYYLKQALSWGAAFVFGLVLILLMPGFFTDVVRSARRYLPASLFGVATLVGVPFLAILACITIVGLAVGVGGLLLWIVAVYSAQVFVAAWLGELLMGAPAGTGAVIGRLAVGLVILKVVGMLPYVGPLIKLLVLFLGLGSIAMALYKRSQPVAVAA